MLAISRYIAIAALLTPMVAHAGGFGIDEQDAAATGRGGTAGARAEASSAYYNPAGLAGVGSLDVELGATGIAPSGSATDPSGEKTDGLNKVYLPPYLYAARRDGRLAYGLAVNAPFGLGTSWPTSYQDRFEVESASFQTLAVMASGAYQVIPALSLGLSVGAMHTTFDLTRGLDFVTTEGDVHLNAGGWGLGVILGARYTVGDVAAFGLSGSLPAPTRLSGTARFHGVPEEFGPLTNDQDISTKVTLPARLRAAGSFQVAKPVRIDADLTYTFWSSFKSLDIAFSDPNTPASGQEKDWNNALTAHLGGEYHLPAVADFRAGLSFDQAVAPLSTLGSDAPDGNRWQFCLGAGRELWQGVRADLAYAFLLQQTRTSQDPNFPATFTGHAHLLALSIGFKLPEPGQTTNSVVAAR
ncbi:MAG: outer membrane protein transport protein [Deltaproteobacteria bacterium]|nr:outer membrane protein transport protein [Deltaproteobacteria bacterium]